MGETQILEVNDGALITETLQENIDRFVIEYAFGPKARVLAGVAIWRKSQELRRTSFGFFVAVGLLSVPVYLTGEPAEEMVKSLPGVSKAIVEQHEEAAAVAFTGVIIMGLPGLAGLAASRGGRLTPAWFVSTTLGASVIVVALVGWTAHGGQVRHTEIRPACLSGEGSVGGAAQSLVHPLQFGADRRRNICDDAFNYGLCIINSNSTGPRPSRPYSQSREQFFLPLSDPLFSSI